MSRYFVKGAFARAWGRVALFLGRSQGARGVRRVQGAFAGCKGRLQGRGAFARARNSCMIVFAADVRFFVNLNFMYIFIIIFEG